MNTRIFSTSLSCAIMVCGCANSVTVGPRPGTEASLHRYVESLEAGQPNYDEMTPQMASTVRRQLPAILASIKPLGPLKSITFEPSSLLRDDLYLVTFEHGKAEWRIGPLTADGKVQRRGFHIVNPSGGAFEPMPPLFDPFFPGGPFNPLTPPPPPNPTTP